MMFRWPWQNKQSIVFEMKEMKQYFMILGGMFFLYVFLLLFVNTAEPIQPIIKSIKITNGDIIDCVDVYKQPVFQGALLENNAIIGEMKPFDFTMNRRTNMNNAVVHQVWRKSGKCPNRTIPVRRMARNVSRLLNQKYPNACYMELAKIQAREGIFGARANINIWSTKVEPNEWSISAISIYNRHLSFIQLGLMVSPTIYEDDGKPRLFIRTVDTQRGTECFNLACTGFVQISREYALGAAVAPSSEYGGAQYEVPLTLYKYHKAWSEHDVSGKWCAMLGDTVVGYWPSSPFPEFDRGLRASWGGELCNTYGGRHRHTASGMGSGRVPAEGGRGGRSAYVRGMEVLEDRGGDRWRRPAAEWMLRKTTSGCYSVDTFVDEDGEVWARFGGTGRAAGCCGSYCERVPSRVVKQYVRRFSKRRGWYWAPADAPF